MPSKVMYESILNVMVHSEIMSLQLPILKPCNLQHLSSRKHQDKLTGRKPKGGGGRGGGGGGSGGGGGWRGRRRPSFRGRPGWRGRPSHTYTQPLSSNFVAGGALLWVPTSHGRPHHPTHTLVSACKARTEQSQVQYQCFDQCFGLCWNVLGKCLLDITALFSGDISSSS